MYRSGLLAGGIVFCLALTARGADVVGTVTAVDTAKNTLSIKVDKDVTTYALTPDCKVYKRTRAGKQVSYIEMKAGLKAVAVGNSVTLTTDFQDGKDVTTRIKIETGVQQIVPVPRKKKS